MSSLREAIAEAHGDPRDDPAPTPEPVVADNSVLASVRRRAAALQAETTIDLPIPGYGNLVGRYHGVSISQFNRLEGGEVRVPFMDWAVAADALATALTGLYGLTSEETVPLYASGAPALYDLELAQTLGLTPTEHTARGVMVELFGGGEIGQSRIWSHFLSYQAWLMQGSQEEVANKAVGEYLAP